MQIRNQSGFSLVHVLPVVAIMAVIAFTGTRLLGDSHALTGELCSATYRKSGYTVYYTVTVKNSNLKQYSKPAKVYTRTFGSIALQLPTVAVPSIAPGGKFFFNRTANFKAGSVAGVQTYYTSYTGERSTCANSPTYTF